CIGFGGRGSTNRTGGNGRIAAESKFILHKVTHATVIHDQKDDVGFGGANLKAYASTFNLHRGGSAPTGSPGVTAHRKTPAKFSADDEAGLFHAGDDDDAFCFVEQIVRDAFIRSVHHI